jgi:G3E family GTPase
MRILAVVGPVGAGKTTMVRKLITELKASGFPTNEQIAFVLNDEGGRVDGELAGKSAQVIAMTNGCFTCADPQDLRDILSRLEQQGITWVFLEGFGITAGSETRQFLESCSYRFHIFCLLSARDLKQDHTRNAGVLQSQVRAATLGVGITKTSPNQVLDLESTSIPDLVARHNPGKPIVLIREHLGLPSLIMNLFNEEHALDQYHHMQVGEAGHSHHSHHHDECAGCEHHSHHDHDTPCGHHEHGGHTHHGIHTYSYPLRQEAPLETLRVVLKGKDILFRVKAILNGVLLNVTNGVWKITPLTEGDHEPPPFVTFYSTRSVEIDIDLPGLSELIIITENSDDDMPSYALLRRETVSPDETVEEIAAILGEFPKEPIIVPSLHGLRLITHPEKMQTVKEMARRPSVSQIWFPEVLRFCMEYWIKCAQVLRERETEICPADIGKHKYELAVSLVWWVNRHSVFFGQEIVDAVKDLHPGEMAAQGIVSLHRLIPIRNQNGEKISWQREEFTEALMYGITHGDNPYDMIGAATHCLSLASDQDLKHAWSASITHLVKHLVSRSIERALEGVPT